MFWLSCIAVEAFVLVLALATFYPKNQPSPDSKLALIAPSRLNAIGRDAMPDARLPVDLYHLAINALWVPLLDDEEPPRWTDAMIDFGCDPGTSVMVDGEPMVAGKLIPATTFTVHSLENLPTIKAFRPAAAAALPHIRAGAGR